MDGIFPIEELECNGRYGLNVFLEDFICLLDADFIQFLVLLL